MGRPRVKLRLAVCGEQSTVSIAILESELRVDVLL